MNGNIETAFIDRVGTDPESRMSLVGNARLARSNNTKAAATTATAPPILCVQCNERTRLAALTRCRECFRSAAAEDRDSKIAAEARVSAKEQRQVALDALGDAFLTFASTPEGQQFLQQQHAELVGPRNEPEYLNAVVERDRQREVAANEIAVLHHIVKHGRSHGTVTFKNDRDLAKTREAFRNLQSLLEAKLYCHSDPHDPVKSTVTSKRVPKNEFGRAERPTRSVEDQPATRKLNAKRSKARRAPQSRASWVRQAKRHAQQDHTRPRDSPVPHSGSNRGTPIGLRRQQRRRNGAGASGL